MSEEKLIKTDSDKVVLNTTTLLHVPKDALNIILLLLSKSKLEDASSFARISRQLYFGYNFGAAVQKMHQQSPPSRSLSIDYSFARNNSYCLPFNDPYSRTPCLSDSFNSHSSDGPGFF